MGLVYRRAVFMVILLASFFAPSAGRGAEVDDLKATFEQGIAAVNKRDLDAASVFWHDQIVSFGLHSPFPMDGKAAMRQFFQTVLDNTESSTVTPINFQYRVIGDTGIAWGHIRTRYKPKDGPMHVTFGRELITYTKVDGQWRVIAVHVSLIPSGN